MTMRAPLPPVVLETVLDDPGLVDRLARANAPYFPVQRYFESGFPYGRNQWISTSGTSWASLAIAQTLPDAR